MDDVTVEETDRAIKRLKSDNERVFMKSPHELLKAGGSAIAALAKLFNRYWHRLEVLDEWNRGVIVKLSKNLTYRNTETAENAETGEKIHYFLYPARCSSKVHLTDWETWLTSENQLKPLLDMASSHYVRVV